MYTPSRVRVPVDMSSSYSGRSGRTGQYYDAQEDRLLEGFENLALGGAGSGPGREDDDSTIGSLSVVESPGLCRVLLSKDDYCLAKYQRRGDGSTPGQSLRCRNSATCRTHRSKRGPTALTGYYLVEYGREGDERPSTIHDEGFETVEQYEARRSADDAAAVAMAARTDATPTAASRTAAAQTEQRSNRDRSRGRRQLPVA